MDFVGTNNSDTKQGTADADTFDMAQGGVDTVNGNGGDDTIEFGATLTAADKVNGGEGEDTLILDGDYSAGVIFNSTTVRFVENLEMTEGHSYAIETSNNTVAAGQVMTVSAYGVGFGGTGHYFHFDGSAETDGRFNVADSYGNDILIGSQGSDALSMSYGGIDYIDGQGGGDVLMAENNFGVGDIFDGGTGSDIVYFRGLQGGQIALNGANFKNIETLNVTGDFGASFLAADSLLAAGQMLNIDVRTLAAGLSVIFNGSQETDGWFDFYDGASNDLFTGGAGGDLFRMGNGAGNSGSDFLSGLGGDDTFGMNASLDSSDIIYGGSGYDTVDLLGDYSAGVAFGGDGLAGVERFTLREGFTYKLTFADGNLNTGEGMLIGPADNLGVGKFVHIDASAEADAAYTMYDSGGNDTLIGGGGNDVFWMLAGGKDKAIGGAGSDTFVVAGVTSNGDSYNGGADGDTLTFYNAAAGAVVNLAAGKFTLGGAQGGSVTQIENVTGSAFDDTITGNNVANFVAAGNGDDTVLGGQGDDWLLGEIGNDNLKGEAAEDHLEGGEGNDTLDGGTQDDELSGGNGIDTLIGGAGNDDLYGGAQNDALSGDAGIDLLFGEDGHDELNGGIGNDTLQGDAGRDTFVFATGTGIDTVKDFTNNYDYLDFSGSVANSFADIQANMAQVGADVVITFGTDKFILTGVNLGVLDAGDFLF